MQRSSEIVFRHMPRSPTLEKVVQKRIHKLERRFSHITSCEVVMEETHHHKHQGKLFHIRIDLNVPTKELVVSKEKHDLQAHENPYIAVRDAFNAMEKQLDSYTERLRGDIKEHSRPTLPSS